ncbi:hypothetical protein [Chryseobacterium sp. 5_R23647]|uniref:hypothetical protein n=1 Tax=Chryseobacterium sp. 5_R23647 TaxID=2258964 RepID=UPI000E22F67A|nr:hypothetical protein [Chryseobacterium sp. 5_R23647]REC43619.1 hypothetical protein DRF69_07880 [Chryseobacterium sp. 5_R23647]
MNKYVLKIILPIILVLTFKLNAQQKVYYKQEIGKFKENEQFYLNKKVKNVLRDLKVNFEIAYVGGGWSEETSFITFRFNNRKDDYQLQQKGIKPARLTLFIKERDVETNKLFYSVTKRITFYRDSLKNKSNKQILKDYKNLTVAMIYANSEQPEIKKE